MTEAEWLACENPQLMLVECFVPMLTGKQHARQRDLLCVACARLVWTLLPRDVREAIEWNERTAGRGFEDDFGAFMEYGRALEQAAGRRGPIDQAAAPYLVEAAWRGQFNVAMWHLCDTAVFPFADPEQTPKHLAKLLHDIFGNPFRLTVLDPLWLTFDVQALAQGIYAERAFERMPILGDALQDAGCDNADVLKHCRDATATHVRGCWVLDLLLEKG